MYLLCNLHVHRPVFFNQGAVGFHQGCLNKMPKNVYKAVGGSSLPFAYTKPQVFILHHNNLPATRTLRTSDIIS